MLHADSRAAVVIGAEEIVDMPSTAAGELNSVVPAICISFILGQSRCRPLAVVECG